MDHGTDVLDLAERHGESGRASRFHVGAGGRRQREAEREGRGAENGRGTGQEGQIRLEGRGRRVGARRVDVLQVDVVELQVEHLKGVLVDDGRSGGNTGSGGAEDRGIDVHHAFASGVPENSGAAVDIRGGEDGAVGREATRGAEGTAQAGRNEGGLQAGIVPLQRSFIHI